MTKQIETTLDSREVAEMVGKEHRKLLRDVRNYIAQLGETKIGPSDFFQVSTYLTEQNKKMPCYLVTKKGCEFIAHKLTGVKGTEFTARYINRFHEMEDVIAEVPQARAVNFGSLNNAAKIMSETFKDAGVSPEFIALTVGRLYTEKGDFPVTLPIQVQEQWYDRTEMANLLGVYNKNGTSPHPQAIGAILERNVVADDEIIIAPYENGHAGTYEKYKAPVKDRLEQWLIDNNYPSTIKRANGNNVYISYPLLDQVAP